jgi:hypothetical protein
MDAQRKTIQSQTVSLDSKREQLTAFYLQFGGILLADSAATGTRGSAVGPERVEVWNSCMSAREADTRAILEIKSALNRQQELYQFRKELGKNLAEEQTARNRSFEEMGRILFRQYRESDEDTLGALHDRASAEQANLDRLERKQALLKEDLQNSAFIGKILTQFKMTGIASSIRQQSSRLANVLSGETDRLYGAGLLGDIVRSGRYDATAVVILDRIEESRKRLDMLEQRSASLDSDLAAIGETLSLYGAAGNPLARVDELHLRIKDTDRRIDSLRILTAREYADKFLDEEGVSLLGNAGDGHTFSDMGVYSHQLEQIAQLRSSIAKTRRRIEVLETTLKIESLDRTIVSYKRSVSEYEQKIEHYRKLAESMQRSIGQAEEERLLLLEQRGLVEKKLAGDE